MLAQLQLLWGLLRITAQARIRRDESGSVVETVVITAIFAALAIAIGAVIVSKITAKANSIDLG